MTFLKSILFLFGFLWFCQFSAQQKYKDYSNILRSTNIYEIDAFLRDAHPDDPKRTVLKPRLIKMLKEYIKNAHPADQRVKDFQEKIALLRRRPSTRISFEEMNEIIRQKQIAKFKEELTKKTGNAAYVTKAYGIDAGAAATAGSKNFVDTETEEFTMLMTVNPIEHKNNTVKILNSLFDNDPNSKESIVMIENKSDCNIIMRIEGVGNTKYRLPIPAHSENTIVVAKGDYIFGSLVCGAEYSSQKTVQKAIIVSLGDSPTK
ncbi:DUF6759 domain-containing protein [Kaistella palustris]|uniref:DUF6759 domain-containing protein n=1 Tax=Kaistella palustris TaxID=493376 RepID=UPI000421C402|nr:DUF6759 domain-containing protein [Kaistella palustris]